MGSILLMLLIVREKMYISSKREQSGVTRIPYLILSDKAYFVRIFAGGQIIYDAFCFSD
jgi:hypothetical protein